jgi:hypothetical protein
MSGAAIEAPLLWATQRRPVADRQVAFTRGPPGMHEELWTANRKQATGRRNAIIDSLM